ncbi:hypothetical protein, partial [Anaerobiospirillum sp. NML120449]|uniref:beta strand repeat-containing protein n=1 Tax=Anaerobiospirillum sp. NML120449 TaxID=2932817 RepID=UPI001FF2AEFA
MKLSNNAIKFLMAQYRAIYKNAYFKGIASAVVLTSVMAAGQAQAADFSGSTVLTGNKVVISSTDVEGYTKFEKITVTTAPDKDFSKVDFLVQSGDATSNKFDPAAQGGLTFTGKSLTVSAKGAGVSIAASGADATKVTFTDLVNVSEGTIKINASGSTGAGSLESKVITIGSTAASGSTAPEASVIVSKSGSVGTTVATADICNLSQIKLLSGGTLATQSGAGGAISDVTINAGRLVIDGGKLQVFNKTDSGASATLNLVSGQMKSGEINVGTSGDLTIKFDHAANVTDATIEGTDKKVEKTFDIQGGKLALTGSTTVSGVGTIKIADAVEIAADAATLKLSGSGAATGQTANLKGTSAKISELLGATKTTTKFAVLEITDAATNAFDVKALQFSGDASTKGKIHASGTTIILADNLAVTESGANTTNVNLEARNNLTLGAAGTDLTSGIGYGSLKAKNVSFVGQNDATAFKLANALTLSSTAVNNGQTVADSGTISGDVELTKALTVDGGIYTNSGKIKVNAGSIVANGASVDSKFTAARDTTIEITNGSGSAITASGSKAVVDLSNANVTVTALSSGTSGDVAVTANDGKVIVTGEQFKTVSATIGGKSGSFVIKGKGTLNVTTDLELAQGDLKPSGTKISNVPNSSGIHFDSGSTGTLKVDGVLTITGAQTAVAVGAKDSVIAGTLALQGTGTENKLGAGNFTVLDGITSVGGTTAAPVTVSGSVLTLGSAADDGGELGASITIGDSSSSGAMSVAGGTWTGSDSDITVTSGSLTVGGQVVDPAAAVPVNAAASLSANKLTGTSGDVAVKKNASLTLKELNNAASTITIDEGAAATTNKLTITGGKINISGTMTVKGDAADTTNKGVSLAGSKTVAVTDKGFLEFGTTAVGSMLNADGTDLGTSLNGFAAGSIDLQTGGTVKFGFDSGVTLDSTDLKKLRGVFGVASGSLTAGVLDLGNATITGVTGEGGVVSEDGTVKWTDIKGFADVNSDVVNKDLADVIVTNISEDVRGNFGSLQQAAGSTGEQIGISTSSSLSGADKNNGLFASDSTGKNVVGLNVKNGTLTLNNSGKVGKVTLATGSVLKLNAGQGGSITVQGDVAGAKAELLVNTGTANVTGAANVGFIDSANGSTLNAASLKANSTTDANIINGALNVTETAEFAGAVQLNGSASVGTFTAKSTLDTSKGSSLKVTTGAFTADKTVDAQGTIEVTGSGSVATFKAEAELAADGNKFVDVNFDMDAAILGNTEAAGKV